MRNSSPAQAEGVLSPAVVVWRAAHGLIAIGFLASIGYVWWCALTGQRGRLMRLAITALAGERVLVVANRATARWAPWAIGLAIRCHCSSWCCRRAQRAAQSPRSEP